MSGERTAIERTSDRDLKVTRTVRGPRRLVWEAWTRGDLFGRWWVPASFGLTLLTCEIDARVGGRYRLEFRHGDATMAFFGTYVDVVPFTRLSWTNDETDGGPVTTVTFDDDAGGTRVVVHDRYPSKEALEAGAGSMAGMAETLDQLDALLAAWPATA